MFARPRHRPHRTRSRFNWWYCQEFLRKRSQCTSTPSLENGVLRLIPFEVVAAAVVRAFGSGQVRAPVVQGLRFDEEPWFLALSEIKARQLGRLGARFGATAGPTDPVYPVQVCWNESPGRPGSADCFLAATAQEGGFRGEMLLSFYLPFVFRCASTLALLLSILT